MLAVTFFGVGAPLVIVAIFAVSLLLMWLIGKTDEEMSELRGTKISMIFQDPLSALTPMFSIGDQLAEAQTYHHQHC